MKANRLLCITFIAMLVQSAMLLAEETDSHRRATQASTPGAEAAGADRGVKPYGVLVDEYLAGSSSAAIALQLAGLDAWETVRPRWQEADAAQRWTLLELRGPNRTGCVPFDIAHPYAIESISADDQGIRWRAMAYVADYKVEGARDALLKRLDVEEPLRWRILDLLRLMGAEDDAHRYVIKALSDEDRQIRWRAIWYVNHNRIEDARAVLMERLDDEEPAMRWPILEALARIGGEGVAQKLIPLLDADSWAAKGEGLVHPPDIRPHWWPDGRHRVVEMLGKIDAAVSAGAMLRVLKEQEPGQSDLATAIIPCLEQFKHRPALPHLRKILAFEPPPPGQWMDFQLPRPDRYIRRLAARALLSMDDDSGVELLDRELEDGDIGVRRFAAKSFSQYGLHAHLPLLAKALRDDDWRARRAAVLGFRRLAGIELEGEERGFPEDHAQRWLTWWEDRQQ